MSNAFKYPKYAATCIRLARGAETIERRSELLDLAETWLKLFDDCVGTSTSQPLDGSTADGFRLH